MSLNAHFRTVVHKIVTLVPRTFYVHWIATLVSFDCSQYVSRALFGILFNLIVTVRLLRLWFYDTESKPLHPRGK